MPISMSSATFTFECQLERSSSGAITLPNSNLARTSEGAPRQPLDYAYMRKFADHERRLQEVTNQWPLATPWCGSIGVDTKDILGIAPSGPSYDDDLEGDLPATKRAKGKAVADDDMDASFEPIEHPQAAAPPAPTPAWRPASPMKASTKRPRAAPIKQVPHTAVKKIAPRARELDVENLHNVRCDWGGCRDIIERLMWQAHMDEVHKLKLQGYKTGWHCQWRGCEHRTKTHACMETHLRETHFVKDLPFCGVCGELFDGLDLLEQHVANQHGVDDLAYC